MIIEVSVRSVYGNELIYPMNEAAIVAAALTRRKTLTVLDLQNLTKLEHVVRVVDSPDNSQIAIALRLLATA